MNNLLFWGLYVLALFSSVMIMIGQVGAAVFPILTMFILGVNEICSAIKTTRNIQ